MFKYKIFKLLTIILFFSSCEQKIKKTMCNQGNLLCTDSLYSKKTYVLKYADLTEEIELYTTKKKDTFINSIKVYNKDSIIRKLSFYYDLKVSTSEKPNIYNGEIILNSNNYNFKNSKKRRRKIYFTYNNICKDSLYAKVIMSKNNLPIKFKFENCYNNTLQGVIMEIIEIDTLKDKIRQKINKLGVDNYNITDNLLFDIYEIDKRFSLQTYIKEKTQKK